MLNIGSNKITFKAADAIASVILNNIQMEELNLSNNFLGSGVKEIAIALKHTSKLRLLNLSNNEIPESVAEDLAGAVLCNNSLQFIRLMNNVLKTKGSIKIFQAISRLKAVKVLNFYNNQISKEAADAICKSSVKQFGTRRNISWEE